MHVFDSMDAAAGAKALRGAALCLGNFDGVHLGHQALLQAASALGPPAVLTFEPHPGKVLSPELAPRLIATSTRKRELLEAAGVTACVVHPFTRAFAGTSPQQFEGALFDGLGVGAVVVGYDFTYGKARAGTVESLARAAAERKARVDVVKAVTVEGVVVSSTKVREYVLEGRVEAATRLLGRPFDLDGVVVTGAQRGRTIGFPTANVAPEGELQPAPGVYAISVTGEGLAGAVGGACNIGVKPTFGGTVVTIECHLLDFSGDLYGRRLRVAFLERLRAERRFASIDELKGQIAKDVAAARDVLRARS